MQMLPRAGFSFSQGALLGLQEIDRATLGRLKNDKNKHKQVPVARHGLILRQDGATGSKMIFIYVLGLSDAILGRF